MGGGVQSWRGEKIASFCRSRETAPNQRRLLWGLQSEFKPVLQFSPYCGGGCLPLPIFIGFSHSFPTAATPFSTQSAPGFALFGLFRVRFAVFVPFSPARFSCRFLCALPLTNLTKSSVPVEIFYSREAAHVHWFSKKAGISPGLSMDILLPVNSSVSFTRKSHMEAVVRLKAVHT